MQRQRLLVIDPDRSMHALFSSRHHAGLEIELHTAQRSASPHQVVSHYDVVLVGVDTAAGLQVLADLCSQRDGPPVIGIAGQGFENKSLEHVLLLAEVRGAAATIMKPSTLDEIAVAVWAVMVRREGLRPPAQKRA